MHQATCVPAHGQRKSYRATTMTWRPRFTALFTETALLLAAILSGLLLAAWSMWATPFLSAAVLIMCCVALLLLLLRQRSVPLVCFLSRDIATAKVGASLDLMSLPVQRQGATYILDKGRIEIRAITIGIFSGIVIKGGKKPARRYIAEVLKKYINYPKHTIGGKQCMSTKLV